MTGSQRGRGVVAAGLAPAFGVERDRCHVARSCARFGPRPFASTKRAPCYPSARILRPCSDRDVGARQSRDSPRRFRAVSRGGRGGLEARLSLLDPASLLAIQVVNGGGGIRTPEGPNGPLRFSRLIVFRSTMRAQAWCATQCATVRVERAAFAFAIARQCPPT